MTVETRELTEQLREANAGLREVLRRIDATDRRARKHRLGSALLAALLIAVAFLGWRDIGQRNHAERLACERGNATRADIRAAIVETVLVIVTETDQPDQLVVTLVDRIQDRLVETIPDRDCT